MSMALDLGTSRLRSLRREARELIGRAVPAAFALVADDQSARDLLSRSSIAFAAGEGELALVGEAALTHAPAFRTRALRLLPGGVVPADDPPARQIIGALVESLLPEPNVPGEPCGMILPVAALEDESSSAFFARLVQLRGYLPRPISASHAVALATLASDGFSGLAFSLGAGGCSISLVHRGRELAHHSESRGTDWIDARLAGAARCYIHEADGSRSFDTDTIRRQRESLADSLSRPTNDFAAQVAEHYRELLLGVLREFKRHVSGAGPFAASLPIVCAGGGTRAAGFTGLMIAAIDSAELPFTVGPVRLAPSDDYLAARGALIHAELDSTSAAAA